MNETSLRTWDHSPGYGAPEIVNDERETSDYTNAVDLWCVGVTAFRMLTAKLPFPNNATVVRYEEGKFSFPTEDLRSQNSSYHAVNFVQRLLSAIPSHRPSVDIALNHAWFADIASSTVARVSSPETERQLPLRPVPAFNIGQATRNPQLASYISAQSSRKVGDDEDRTITSTNTRGINARPQHAKSDVLAQDIISSGNQATYSKSSLPHIGFAGLQGKESPYLLSYDPLTMNDSALWESYFELANILNRRPFSPEWLAFDNGTDKPLLWWAVTSEDLAITSGILKIPEIDINSREAIHGWSGLTKSVIEGNVEMCHLLLQQPRINPNQRDYDWGLTPLMIAAADGNATIVELLLRHGLIDVNLKDIRWGRTALSWAAGNGQREIARILLKYAGTDITINDSEGASPLAWAVAAENLQTVELLHTFQPFDHVDKDFHGRTPLWRAARKGHTSITKFLLATDQGHSVVTDHRGCTPLIVAADRGHKDIVSELLFPNLNSNAIHSNLRWKDRSGQNALIRASKSGHNELVHLMLTSIPLRERRNIIDDVDNHDRTALSWAAAEGHIYVTRTLLQMGSRGTIIPDDQEQIPLHKAVQGGHEAIATILLRAEPWTGDLKDTTGRTPLSWAAGQGALGILKLLLTVEVDVNSWDNKNWTVAHWAAVCGQSDCLTALFSHSSFNPHDRDGHTLLTRIIDKGDPDEDNFPKFWWFYRLPKPILDFPDKNGRTPLSWAAQTGNEEFAQLLLGSRKVNPSFVDADGWTPMSYAVYSGHQVIATWLYNCEDLHQWDKQNFWRSAPRWAVKDRILSKAFPGIHPKIGSGFKVSGYNKHLTDARTFRGMNPISFDSKPQAELLIDYLLMPRVELGTPPSHDPDTYHRMYKTGWGIHLSKHSENLKRTYASFVYRGWYGDGNSLDERQYSV
jgi:ankyrin repeat protein